MRTLRQIYGDSDAAVELCAASEEFLNLVLSLDEFDGWDTKRLELAIEDFKFKNAAA